MTSYGSVITSIDTGLAAIAYLMIKHAIGDFFLQTAFQWQNKGRYGHPGGIVHVAIHALLTFPVFLIMPPRLAGLAVLIVVGEALVHYHIDWFKDRLVRTRGLTPSDNRYWQAMGIDQLLHGLTYLAIVKLLAAAA
jgi:hypothetical protein